ncbi:AraC family transcriptional regulator [Bermanella marisrubri]|uniref:AraC-type DNA-binding domain-containing protein n=1 Tax=Bermanella marisrubri TaxID=207949 RepID=Q1N2P4_9GAMM|nr:AraC family transcriptional regulator [Bermanella marisrubri]EAT12625.1 AraC-type DNA-binding domain-containing protein [Oceanobacter sp. RED65] [Bermanella marisrubri]
MIKQMPSGNDVKLSILGDQPYPAYELRNIVRFLDDTDWQAGAKLLDQIQISEDELKQDFIPAYKVLDGFHYCAKHYGPVLAARIGQSYSVEDLGVFGYAIASSQNLGHALALTDQYHSLLGNLLKRVTLSHSDYLKCKLLNIQNLDADTLSFFIALSNSAKLHLGRKIFGDDLHYQEVFFTFSDEDNRAVYETIYGCPIEFNADHNGWSIDKNDLKRTKLVSHNEDMKNYLPYCNELMEDLKQKDSLVNEIQQILISCAGDYPDIEMLASAFNVSSRTLRRQLANVGTSYQKILNKVRCHLSIEYLSKTDIAIEDISNLIGFSDVTNFRHAFKKWVGQTPSYYRKHYI